MNKNRIVIQKLYKFKRSKRSSPLLEEAILIGMGVLIFLGLGILVFNLVDYAKTLIEQLTNGVFNPK